MQNLAYPIQIYTRRSAQEQRQTQPWGDQLAVSQQPSKYDYATKESFITRPPLDHWQEQLEVQPETRLVIPHTFKQFWNIDYIEPEQRIAYIEQIAAWGEDERLQNPTIELRDIVERITYGFVGSLRRWWIYMATKAKDTNLQSEQAIILLMNNLSS